MEAGLERLNQKPIIDTMDERSLALIKSQVAKDCTDGEVGYFLELAAHYDLDPFAKEIWCIKNRGRLLIMVGRDGLRKIAQRQRLRVDCDVVRENDEFSVGRNEHGRVVTHSYGKMADRGAICGAWCEVTTEQGHAAGFFYAPLSEYRPANVNEHSPWAKQESVMILAAAERQALRQATPLGGLLAEGEMEPDSRASVTAPVGDGSDDGTGKDLGPEVEAIIDRAKAIGHGQLSNRTAVEWQLGRSGFDMAVWLRCATEELNRFAEENVVEPEPLPDADVVDPEPTLRDTVLRNRLQKLQELRAEEQDPEKRGLLDEEIAIVEGEIG